jgi:TonB-dependent starch-binding outer membrane protein SusC
VPGGSMMDRYVDLNEDGVINIDDRRPFHTPAPTWMIGHSSRFEYGDLGLGYGLRAHLGNYV